jgi:hypothetical protein
MCETGKHSEEGIGLVAVIIIITIFTTLAIIVSSYLWTNNKMNGFMASQKKAFYIAESGIDFAIRKSLDTANWDWSQSGNYGGGNISVTISSLGDDSVRISSVSQVGEYGKKHTADLSVINLMDYSVYITGTNLNVLGYDLLDHLRFNTNVQPVLDLDSLKAVAQAQGHYDPNNLTISNGTPRTRFWSNPGDHSQDATIHYIEGNLTISKSNDPMGGIFVVKGNVTLKDIQDLYGVIYMANDSQTKTVAGKNKFTKRRIYGGIVGKCDLNGGSGFYGPRISVYYNATVLSKFYTYAVHPEPVILEKLLWTQNY